MVGDVEQGDEQLMALCTEMRLICNWDDIMVFGLVSLRLCGDVNVKWRYGKE